MYLLTPSTLLSRRSPCSVHLAANRSERYIAYSVPTWKIVLNTCVHRVPLQTFTSQEAHVFTSLPVAMRPTMQLHTCSSCTLPTLGVRHKARFYNFNDFLYYLKRIYTYTLLAHFAYHDSKHTHMISDVYVLVFMPRSYPKTASDIRTFM